MEIALGLNLVLGIRGVHLNRRCLGKGTIDLLGNLGARQISCRRAIRVVLNIGQRRIHERVVDTRNILRSSLLPRDKGTRLKSLTHSCALREDTVQHNRDHRHQWNGRQVVRLACGSQQHDTELHRKPKDCVQSLSHSHVRQRNKVGPIGGGEQPRRIVKPEHLVHLLVESPEFFSRTFF